MNTGIQNQEHHAVVGAGLVGSLLGLMLAQRHAGRGGQRAEDVRLCPRSMFVT